MVPRRLIALGLLCLAGGLAGAPARTVLDTRQSYLLGELPESVRKRVVRDLSTWGTQPTCPEALVRDFARGHFTQRAEAEELYVVQDCLRDSRTPDGLNPRYWKLAVYRGGRLRQVLPRSGQQIGNVGDLNGDGLDDVVFLARTGEAGVDREGATFLTLAGGKVHRFLDLGTARATSCASGGYGSVTAYRVTVEPARVPRFTLQEYVTPNRFCDGAPEDYVLKRTWRVVGRARP